MAFQHERSVPILNKTVRQLNRVGQTHDAIETLGQESARSPHNPKTLGAQLKSAKSSAGQFFEMIEGVEFSSKDEGMQSILSAYALALEAVRNEGGTDAHHRPSRGLSMFQDIMGDDLKERIGMIGKAHAHNTYARALFISDLFDEEASCAPELYQSSMSENRGFVHDENARYFASIILAENLTSARDFLAFALDEADHVEMAANYISAIDKALYVGQKQDWQYLASDIYPDSDDAYADLRKDLSLLLDIVPDTAIQQQSEAVQRLKDWSAGRESVYGVGASLSAELTS